MRNQRLIRFFISILVGMVVGILYGWFFRPIKAVDLNLGVLRSDYKTDLVLMVAETYKKPEDMTLAKSHLLLLGKDKPLQIVQQAQISASELGYSGKDADLLTMLANNLQAGTPEPVGEGEN